MSTQPKKQHYVPQFLLKKFASIRKKKAKVWVFDKERRTNFRSSVREVGHENYFYEASPKLAPKIEAEEKMKFVDDRGSRIINLILKRSALPLESKTMVDLHFFAAFQLNRVPKNRNQMEYLRKHMVEKWGENVCFEGSDTPISQFGKEDSAYSSISGMFASAPEIASHLSSKVLFLLEAPDNLNFILSDNPVVRHNHIDYSPRGSLGLKQVGIEIYFPISSKFCLQYLCPSLSDELSKSALGRNWLYKQNLGLPLSMMPENVEFLNSLQVLQSERWIYGNTEADLQIAKEMLAQSPDLEIPASNKTIGNLHR